MTSASDSAMKSPVRFMARGLAERTRHENPRRHDAAYNGGGRDPEGSGGGGRRGGSRQEPAVRPAITQYMRPATMPAPVMISRCRRTMPSKRQVSVSNGKMLR